MHGVDVGVEDRLHQAVVGPQRLEGRQVPVALLQVLAQPPQLRRRARLLGGEEDAELAGGRGRRPPC